MSDNVRLHNTFSPSTVEKIDELVEKEGYLSRSAVLNTAVIQLYSDHFPAYARGRTKTKKDPEKDAEEKEEKNKSKEEKEFEEQTKICEDKLDGEVVEGEGGEKICEFYNYSMTERFEQNIPLHTLSETHVAGQYDPSRKKVKELQENDKVNYEVE